MKLEKANAISVDSLRDKLANSHMALSHLAPDFRLEALFDQVTTCRVIKANERRQVYHIATHHGGYFLKCSTLVRGKDKRRHFLLPFRKWSEWNNLHRLFKAGISTAKPVLKGEVKKDFPNRFFILTEEVQGAPLKVETDDETCRLAGYMAWLHSKGIYHTDLHPDNILVTSEGQHRLIDVQQVFFLPWLPGRLRVHNLGKICFYLGRLNNRADLPAKLIEGYNLRSKIKLSLAELKQAAERHQQRKYSSRSKRCCRNSSEFMVVKKDGLVGYKRKSFNWDLVQLRLALEKGQPLKDAHVIAYRNVCIKKVSRRRLHKNRCLTSWKMSQALAVRGIPVPRALGYFVIDNIPCYISELLDDRLDLNTYLSSITDERTKRRALKKLALWMRKFYDTRVWQRDFKSANILCRDGEYYMLDLDGVKIRPLSEQKKITNLAQLNASLSNAVSLRDRLRFYDYLTAGQKPSRQQRRTIYRRVWDITRTKGTANFDLDIDRLWKPGR